MTVFEDNTGLEWTAFEGSMGMAVFSFRDATEMLGCGDSRNRLGFYSYW